MYAIRPDTRELLFLTKQFKVNRKFTEGITFDPADANFNAWHLLGRDGDMVSITPLFHFDKLESENPNCIVKNNVIISDINELGNNIIAKSENNQNLLIYDNLLLEPYKLTNTNNNGVFLHLKVLTDYKTLLQNIPIDLYYSNDDTTYNLIKSFNTDTNGSINYFVEETGYYKFKYKDNIETEAINV